MIARVHSPAFAWDRSAVLLLVIALHVGGFWLASVYGGLGGVIAKTVEAMQVVPVAPDDPVKPVPRVEPAPLLTPHHEPVFVDPPVFPDVVAQLPADGGITVQAGTGEAPAAGGAGAAIPAIAPTPLAWRETRPIDDYYPPISIRLGEEGVAVLRVCVDANGALQGRPEVQASSGRARLDAAATAWAREALKFTPATDNGARVASCKGFRVRFKLR